MKRLARRWAAFMAALLLALLLAPVWQPLDRAFVAALLVPRNATPPDRVQLLDLPDVPDVNGSPQPFREQLGRALERLAQQTPKPWKVVVDVVTIGDGPGIDAVRRGIDALRSAGVPIYFAVHPDLPQQEQPSRQIYVEGGLAGVGHTAFVQCGDLVLSRTLMADMRTMAGKQYALLSAVVAGADPQALPPMQVVMVPLERPAPLGRPMSRLADWDALPDLSRRIVLVASTEREAHQATAAAAPCEPSAAMKAWQGPELLAWSINDHLRGTAGRPQPIWQAAWIGAAGLATAGAALGLHALGVQWACRRWAPTLLARRLAWVDGGVLLALLAWMALLQWGLWALHWLLPPSFALIAGLLALGVCHWHTRTHLGDMLLSLTRRASGVRLQAEVDVFISYSHAPGNAAWVEEHVVEPLRAMARPDGQPLRLFFDKASIQVGQDWFQRINLSILGSRCFVSVWSDDYLERDYCRWELDYAWPLAARPGFLFVPIAHMSQGSLGEAYAPYLQARQYIDASSRADFMLEVVAQLRRHLAGEHPTASESTPSAAP